MAIPKGMGNFEENRTLLIDSDNRPSDGSFQDFFSAKYCFLLFVGDNKSQIIYLNMPRCTVGRHPSNDVVIDKKSLSRIHLTLVRTDAHNESFYMLFDGDVANRKPSSNGVYVSGKRTKVKRLDNGQIFDLAKNVKGLFVEIELTSQELESDFKSSRRSESGLVTISYSDRNRSCYFLHHIKEFPSQNFNIESVLSEQLDQEYLTAYCELLWRTKYNFKRLYYEFHRKISEINNQFSLLIFKLNIFSSKGEKITQEREKSINRTICQSVQNSLTSRDVAVEISSNQFILLKQSLVKGKQIRAFIFNYYQKLVKSLNKIYYSSVKVSISFGYSRFPNDGDSLEKLLDCAGKDFNNDENCLCESRMREASRRNPVANTVSTVSSAKKQFLRAIKNDELYFDFQPTLNFSTKKIIEIEAFLRWNHSRFGIIPPQKIIPILQRENLSMTLLNWSLHEICSQVTSWKTSRLTNSCLSINVSLDQFMHSDFIGLIKKNVLHHNVDHGSIGIEISLNCLREDFLVALQKINYLADLGICVIIDDFGEKSTSLELLRRTQISMIKISRKLSQSKNTKDVAPAISSAILFGKANEIIVSAQGIECYEQLDFFQRLKCFDFQGYLLNHPQKSLQFSNFLQKQNQLRSK
ncbi:MAG: EAL domain-containing protein [Chlamydiota bacterium]